VQGEEMKIEGKMPAGLEVGNAWDLHAADSPTNWIVGETAHIPSDSLRFMQRDNAQSGKVATKAKHLGVKWFMHKPDDPPAWGQKKQTSEGRTMSLLAGEGEFELVFACEGDKVKVTLPRQLGDRDNSRVLEHEAGP
jgi:hypothetical protein